MPDIRTLSEEVRKKAQENTYTLLLLNKQVAGLSENFKSTLEELLKELPHE